jgi:hypothetical protein
MEPTTRVETTLRPPLIVAMYALALADEIQDGQTGFLIERTLDQARSRQLDRSGELPLVSTVAGDVAALAASVPHRRKILYHENIERMVGN